MAFGGKKIETGTGEEKAVFKSTAYSHSKGDWGCSFALAGLIVYLIIILPFSLLVMAFSIYGIAVSDGTPPVAIIGLVLGGGLCVTYPFLWLVVAAFVASVFPNPSKITAAVDGRGVHTEYGLLKIATHVPLSEIIAVKKHTSTGGVGFLSGRFNPTQPGIIIITAGKTYRFNTEEFDEFAEAIKNYKPEVEISG
jgi:hypothetical protein